SHRPYRELLSPARAARLTSLRQRAGGHHLRHRASALQGTTMKKPSALERVFVTWVTKVLPPWGSTAVDSSRTSVMTSSVPAGQPVPLDSHSAIACLPLPGEKVVSSLPKSGVTTTPVVEGSIPAASETQYLPTNGLVTPVMFFERVTVV